MTSSYMKPRLGFLRSALPRARFPRKMQGATVALLLAVALFSLPASAEWKEKVLYSFQGGTNDGAFPVGGVVFDSLGNLYGVVQDYGPGSCAPIGNECGAVYQLTPPAQKGGTWTETLIYEFQGEVANDGESPNSGLLIDSQGNLYGVTAYGGTGDCVLLGVKAGCGTVYELSPPKEKGAAWRETILYSFPTAKQGYLPNGNLVFDSAGNLYGATMFGGGKGTTCDKFYQYCGAVFELSPPKTKGDAWTEKVLHSFASGTDGANPNGDLVLDSKGNVYGTTYAGGNESGECGSGGCGTVFELNPPATKGRGWTEKVILRFNGQDGATPTAGVIFGRNGKLYGVAYAGGHQGNGGVFELTKPAGKPWAEKVLYLFENRSDGSGPEGALASDSRGNLYGTASSGLTTSGNVFRLKPPSQNGGAWTLTVLHGFSRDPDGAIPTSGVLLRPGALFGTTTEGGNSSNCSFRG